MQWLFRALMIVLAALLLWGGPAAARLPPDVSETVKPEKPAHALRYAQRGGAAFKAKPQRQALRLSRGAPPRLKVARAVRNLSRASVNRKAPGAGTHRLTNTAAARRAQTHSQRRGVFLAGRGHPALAVTPRAPGVATSAARPAPAIARAGTRTPAAGNTRIAANGVSGKGKAVNDNRPAGLTARFNTAARTTAPRRSVRADGAVPTRSNGVRAAATGSRIAIVMSSSRVAGGVGTQPRAAIQALPGGRAALQRLQSRANAKRDLTGNSNSTAFVSRLAFARQIIAREWKTTHRPDSVLVNVPSAKAEVAMARSRNGVVTITDIKRGQLPHGTAGLMISKVMRENGVTRPKEIVFQNVKEVRSKRDYDLGKSPNNTVLARAAKLALKDMGLKPGKVSWEKDNHGNLQIKMLVR